MVVAPPWLTVIVAMAVPQTRVTVPTLEVVAVFLVTLTVAIVLPDPPTAGLTLTHDWFDDADHV